MVKINIKTTNMDMTDAISNYLDEKVAMLKKVIDLDDPAVFVHVEVGKDREGQNTGDDLFKAEIKLTVGGKVYYANTLHGDLYAAIDETKDEIMRQARRSQNKMFDLMKRGARKVKKRLKGIKPWGRGQQ
ncbi:MAG: ribosome-associated translation inhibitor RaiA [Candidatus Nomurabacteria bacterium]|nr:ribosome-associated translation inhibitor RaiA [Candidatus Nomurabacteria bacterium]